MKPLTSLERAAARAVIADAHGEFKRAIAEGKPKNFPDFKALFRALALGAGAQAHYIRRYLDAVDADACTIPPDDSFLVTLDPECDD